MPTGACPPANVSPVPPTRLAVLAPLVAWILLASCAAAYPARHEPGRTPAATGGRAEGPPDLLAAEAELARAQGELDRLAMDGTGAPAGCDRALPLADNICALAERICAIAAGAPDLPSGPARCADARARCRSAREKVTASCPRDR
jgi:hypothetical protein